MKRLIKKLETLANVTFLEVKQAQTLYGETSTAYDNSTQSDSSVSYDTSKSFDYSYSND